MDNLREVQEGLSELETPLLDARNLAFAARMMASADEMPKDAGAAIDAVADILFEKLIVVNEERARLWKLACKITKEVV